jgi:hypothetical protein
MSKGSDITVNPDTAVSYTTGKSEVAAQNLTKDTDMEALIKRAQEMNRKGDPEWKSVYASWKALTGKSIINDNSKSNALHSGNAKFFIDRECCCKAVIPDMSTCGNSWEAPTSSVSATNLLYEGTDWTSLRPQPFYREKGTAGNPYCDLEACGDGDRVCRREHRREARDEQGQ